MRPYFAMTTSIEYKYKQDRIAYNRIEFNTHRLHSLHRHSVPIIFSLQLQHLSSNTAYCIALSSFHCLMKVFNSFTCIISVDDSLESFIIFIVLSNLQGFQYKGPKCRSTEDCLLHVAMIKNKLLSRGKSRGGKQKIDPLPPLATPQLCLCMDRSMHLDSAHCHW